MSGTGGVYPIDALGLAVTVLLVAVAAGISAKLRLGVARRTLWAAVRALVQLLAMGYILKLVIAADNPALSFGLLAVMVLAAVQIVLAKGSGVPRGLWPQVLLTLAVSVLLEVAVVTELVVRPAPWHAPEVLITMAGALLGNVVTAVAIALTRFFRDMRQRRGEIEMMLALGATPFEASRPSVVDAVKLGLLPTVSQLASSGLVLIPGMMAGQIIAGADPVLAAKYQFVLLAAISALTVIADVIVLALTYRSVFTKDDQLSL